MATNVITIIPLVASRAHYDRYRDVPFVVIQFVEVMVDHGRFWAFYAAYHLDAIRS